MQDKELLAVLRLQATPLIGDIMAKRLIAAFGDATTVFNQTKQSLEGVSGVGSRLRENILNTRYEKLAQKELDYIKKNNISYTYYQDLQYPELLKNSVDSPILLFKKGNIDLENKKILSVVGTRKITSYGTYFCDKLLEELSDLDIVIVSGFAYGVDITAHKAAMRYGMQTVACMGHGMDKMYPKVHQKYVNQVLENGGFITDFWSDVGPNRENFLKRNRIIAGISKATVVVESAKKGGSLVTADIANSYDREVFALPGRVTDIYSQGCNALIGQHKAHVLLDAKDILLHLGWSKSDTTTVTKKKQDVILMSLNQQEQKIYDYLQANDKELLDVLAFKCDIKVPQLATLLLTLELKGVVKPLPGKMYTLA